MLSSTSQLLSSPVKTERLLMKLATRNNQGRTRTARKPRAAYCTKPNTSRACQQRLLLPQAAAAEKTTQTEPWWEKDPQPNIRSVNSIQQLVDSLADAGDRLVIVEYYARWCASCRALYPKLCKLMAEDPEILLLKVEYDDNKQMCKTLGVKFYKGAQGRVDSFTCSLAKIQKLKDAVSIYSAPFCSLQPVAGVEEFPDVVPHAADNLAPTSLPSQDIGALVNPVVVVHSQAVEFLRPVAV